MMPIEKIQEYRSDGAWNGFPFSMIQPFRQGSEAVGLSQVCSEMHMLWQFTGQISSLLFL